MKCDDCNYIAKNNKSLSNHLRWGGCSNLPRIIGKCNICEGGILKKHKTKNQNQFFCSRKCYGDWRSNNCKGVNAPNYVHGKCNDNLLFRASREYKKWRSDIFKRDNYKCVLCGDFKGGNLEADHIKDFALFPELRLNINNGRTLCNICHKKTENYGFKKSNSKKGNKI